VAAKFSPGTAMRFQIIHGDNARGAAMLRERLDQLFKCTWLPTGSVAPVLGAHTGPGLVGVVYALQAAFADMP
jgi:fatty acid-binding protein DegV